ncbi:type VII secretion-associated protein [Corynebacterium sp. BCW_4722]|nr:type VII secretion-associated protein [Corynebacterium sp. BCW_4722]
MTTAQRDTAPALRITATDMSTVFTGAANVHRFDAPSSREIASYVRQVLGPQPDGARVHIAADHARLRELEHALAGYDIELEVEELELDDDYLPDPPTDSWQAVEPEGDRSGWIIAAVVAVVAAVVAGVLYATVFSGGGGPDVAADPERALDPTPVQDEVAGEDDGGAPEASISNVPEATVRLEKDGLSVEVPAGFALDADAEGDTWRATGEDPNFRLHIFVEQLYQLPVATMAEQLIADIEADPEIELVETDGHFVTYLERAADGSQALWKTWPEGDTQLFVGCHTRFEPTTVQRATCRMAMDSAEFQKTFATDGTEGANLASNT